MCIEKNPRVHAGSVRNDDTVVDYFKFSEIPYHYYPTTVHYTRTYRPTPLTY
jgi:hypothetical protein